MKSTFQIHYELPETYRPAAAKLYYTAFRQKLHTIFRDEGRGISVLQASFNPAYAIIALLEDQLVGIAGFKDSQSSLVDVKPHTMTHVFGWAGGWLRLLALSTFVRPVEQETMLMDGIVVDPEVRGMGIGSKLLDAVVDLANRRHYKRVRLDVVDTNPRARQLYERKGFVATQTKQYPYLSRLFGFAGSTTMVKSIATI